MLKIIFKPTERCNSNCRYCDVVRKRKTPDMTREMLKLVFSRIGEYLAATPGEAVKLVWHGGEPLLLGADYFRFAADCEDRFLGAEKKRLLHSVQSNLTLLTPEILDAAKLLRLESFGTSYEPMPEVRGFGHGVDWQAYNKKLESAVELLKSSGFRYGIIYVVTRKSLDRATDIFHALTNFCGQGGVIINPVLIYGEDPCGLRITPEQFAGFIGEIFPVWWKNRQRYPSIFPFEQYVNNIIHGEKSLSCNDSGDCARSFMYIGPAGSVSQCGRAADWNIVSYGNIRERSLAEILADGRRGDFERRNVLLRTGECRGCRLWGLCHGGCPLDSFPANGDILHKSYLCQATKIFVEKYFEPITGTRYDEKN